MTEPKSDSLAVPTSDTEKELTEPKSGDWPAEESKKWVGEHLEHLGDPHPIQQIREYNSITRFRRNEIVLWLLDAGPFDMNTIALMPFNQEDRVQFAQLIGYSVDGFFDLPYTYPGGQYPND